MYINNKKNIELFGVLAFLFVPKTSFGHFEIEILFFMTFSSLFLGCFNWFGHFLNLFAFNLNETSFEIFTSAHRALSEGTENTSDDLFALSVIFAQGNNGRVSAADVASRVPVFLKLLGDELDSFIMFGNIFTER